MTNSSNEALLQQRITELERQLRYSRQANRKLENEISDLKVQLNYKETQEDE